MKTTACLILAVILGSACQSATPDLAGLPAELAVPLDAMDVRREAALGRPAQWQNQAGDIVLYALRYESALPADSVYDAKPDNSDLRVTALWIPAATVKQMQALVR